VRGPRTRDVCATVTRTVRAPRRAGSGSGSVRGSDRGDPERAAGHGRRATIGPPHAPASTHPERIDELDAWLETVALAPDSTAPDVLVALVAWLRPARRSDGAAAAHRIALLAERLESHTAWRDALRRHLRAQFLNRTRASAYTDPGILSTAGLLHNVWHRLTRKVLPDVADDENLYDLAAVAFHDSRDHEWVDAVPRRRGCG